jgi:hypothetical protein
MSHRRPPVLPTLALAALVTILFGASACGSSSEHKKVVEGEPVELGELQYNVIFSRFLNPSDNEDSAYLVGQPKPPPGSAYFGVFFEVQNESDEPQTLADSFTIADADQELFEAVPSESLYALPLGAEVEGQEQVPLVDSTPEQGPIEGSVVIFELPASASENRPLTLEIPGPEGPAEVTLDL